MQFLHSPIFSTSLNASFCDVRLNQQGHTSLSFCYLFERIKNVLFFQSFLVDYANDYFLISSNFPVDPKQSTIIAARFVCQMILWGKYAPHAGGGED